jgi:peptidoglycan hydrolase-like protein with peptidoglycan-binding domain
MGGILAAGALVMLAAACGDEIAASSTHATTHVRPITGPVEPAPKYHKPTLPAKPPPVHFPTLTSGATGGAVLRLQQLLANTGWLPLSFKPKGAKPVSPVAPRDGRFVWRFQPPAELGSQFAKGVYGTATRGAVMAFQAANGLAIDGVAGPQTWHELIADATHGRYHSGYSYVVVHESSPETIDVYWNGHPVFHTYVNTGVPGAPTVTGTYPIFLRYEVTTMRGTNLDGSHYVDPGIPWTSYFNGGDALHGFIRASYGSPQSLGCVEMTFDDAHRVWNLTDYGTLVTVESA